VASSDPRPSRRRWVVGSSLAAALATSLVLAQPPERWDAWRTFLVAPDPERFPVRGIDVSHHQGIIDWGRVKASGQSFVFIKATEGADFRDRRFHENWALARAQGLVTGAYHYFTFCSPGLAQAENFLAVAPRAARTLPLAVDVEFTGNCVGWENMDEIRRELLIFDEHVREHAGYSPLLYTTEDVRRELVPAELHPRGYWLRSLWGEPSEDAKWHFWQYSDTGRVPGVSGVVDLNVFVGPRATWQAVVDGSQRLE
jgi:lysozyme